MHARTGLRDVLRGLGGVHPLADRVAVLPEPPCQRLVEDDDPWRGGVVARGEQAASLERHAERLEVAGRDGHAAGRDDRLARRRSVALGDDDAAAVVPAERQRGREPRGRHAWQRTEPLERAIREGTHRSVVRVTALEQPEPPREDVLGHEPGIDLQQLPEAREEQARADEQHEREAHLRRDERPAERPRMAARGARPSLVTQHRVQVQVADLQRRHETDDDAERHGQGRDHGHHDGVDADLGVAGQVREAGRGERIHGPRAEREPERSACERQDGRLGDELPDHPRAPRAERVARGELAHASVGAHQREVREVDGRDEQHEERAAPEQLQAGPHVPHEIGLERHHPRHVPGAFEHGAHRPGPLEQAGVQRIQHAPAPVPPSPLARGVRSPGGSGSTGCPPRVPPA